MITFTGQSMAALPNGNNRRRMDWGNKRLEGIKSEETVKNFGTQYIFVND
jgi:hypothetical protein